MTKYTWAFSTIALLLMAAASVIAQENLITANSAGKVKLGMTIAEVRNAVAPMRLSRTSDGEGVALIAVKQGRNDVMTIYADEEDRDAPIDNNARVEQIWVWNKTYMTAAGVHPGMLVSAAERRYGKVEEIVRSEIESREFAIFANHPAGLVLRLNSGDGDFPARSSTTTKYKSNASILSINIVGDRMPLGYDEVAFTSEITELHNGCKSVGGEEGGHVSTFCQGPAGYQIHYFDAATVYQLSVADADRDWEETLAMFGLDKLEDLKSVEWRLANGVPFAVIFKHPTSGKIIARGLKGYERLKSEQDGPAALDNTHTWLDNEYKVRPSR